tara:strand:- start:1 stop:621 length:621 start_codon:yes stop_codon:yes gene_type:complete
MSKKLLAWAIILSASACIAWIAGLIIFIHTTPIKAESLTRNTSTDAVIVLTGGTKRISTALDILYNNKAQKLFISGVGKGVDVATLLILSGRLPDNIATYIKHIELGYNATNTQENALEIAQWIKTRDINSAYIVTANYHIHRTLLEIRHLLPDLNIIPYPVFVEQVPVERWWQHPGTFLLLASEYNKYMVRRANMIFSTDTQYYL